MSRSLDISSIRLFSDILSGNTPAGYEIDAISHGSLFKYFPNLDSDPENNFLLDNLDDFLLKNRVFMQIAPNLNDKNESKPQIIGWNNNSAFVQDVIDHLKSNDRELLLHEIQKNLEIFKRATYEVVGKILEHNQQLSILCLTTSSSNSYLWKKYANYYNGICVEFDSSNRSVFALAKKVTYQKNIPILDVSEVFTSTDHISVQKLSQLTNYYFIKTIKWKNEDERRLVSSHIEVLLGSNKINQVLDLINTQLSIKPEMRNKITEFIENLRSNYRLERVNDKCYLYWEESPIKSIYIGKKMDNKTREIIAKKYSQKLDFFLNL